MNYIAKNIDSEKALKAIEEARRFQSQIEREERIKAQAYHEGLSKGLDIADSMFRCSNYEKPPMKEVDESAIYEKAASSIIYEICKELDVSSQDIRNNSKLSYDEKCAMIADRIKAVYSADPDEEGEKE